MSCVQDINNHLAEAIISCGVNILNGQIETPYALGLLLGLFLIKMF